MKPGVAAEQNMVMKVPIREYERTSFFSQSSTETFETK